MTSTSLKHMQTLPSASLLVIDYNLLVQKDNTEITKLFKAASELGFFYLKLNNQLLHSDLVDSMFKLAENVFDLPLDAKTKYQMDGKNGVYYGYKTLGSMYFDRKGTPDNCEFWNISKDEILAHNGINFPQVILDAKDAVVDYIKKSHQIVLVILEMLSVNLGLDSKALPNLHRLMQPSGDQLRLTKSTMHPIQKQHHSDVSLGAHTDLGSITFLFNKLYGLQVLVNGEWLYVPPLHGHAIVNLGDAMVKLTSGLLKSNLHRVVASPHLSEVIDRYSVVYFSRPENEVLMKSLLSDKKEEQGSDVITAQEWGARRVKNLQTDNYTNEDTYEMGRGTETYHEDEVNVAFNSTAKKINSTELSFVSK